MRLTRSALFQIGHSARSWHGAFDSAVCGGGRIFEVFGVPVTQETRTWETSETTYPAGWTEKEDFKNGPTVVWTVFELFGTGIDAFWTSLEEFGKRVSRGIRGFGSPNGRFFRVGRVPKSPKLVQTRVGRILKSSEDVQNAVGPVPNSSESVQTTVGPISETLIFVYPAGWTVLEVFQPDLSRGLPFCRTLNCSDLSEGGGFG